MSELVSLPDLLLHDFFLINRDGSLTPLPSESVTVIRHRNPFGESGEVVGYLIDGYEHPYHPDDVINWDHSGSGRAEDVPPPAPLPSGSVITAADVGGVAGEKITEEHRRMVGDPRIDP